MKPTTTGIVPLLARLTGLGAPRRSLLLVVDGAGWILDEVAEQLASNLPASLEPRIVRQGWVGAADCTIHFISRVWAWTDGVLDRVHPSNRLIGLWWHGRVDSADPAIQLAVERLRRVHHAFDLFQVTCSIARETLIAVGVPSEKIVLLPEGVNVQMFRPPIDNGARMAVRRDLGIDDQTLVVGCFQKDGDGWDAGQTPKLIKGPDVLVEALARLHRRTPIVALIPGPARGYVTRGLTDAGVPFIAPGFVARAAVPRLYHALDLYMSPSRDEGGPAGMLEAMASGVPVVSTRAGMAVDLIDPGMNGALVDVGDADGLADAAAELLQSRERRQAVARRALATIAAYDWSILVPRYVDQLYAPLARVAR